MERQITVRRTLILRTRMKAKKIFLKKDWGEWHKEIKFRVLLWHWCLYVSFGKNVDLTNKQ